MEISLPKELQEMVQQKVESGQYNSTSEVIVDALWLLHYQDRLREIKLEELRAEIQKGLDSGPAQPFDFEGIKARGRERLARQRKKQN
jgi:antitoxin ParD1/3/4